MTKQTIFLNQPAHCALRQAKLVIFLKETHEEVVRAIEDLAIIVLEHGQITVTQQLLGFLADKNVMVVCCNQQHLPSGLLLSMNAYFMQQVRFHCQVAASLPFKKQLWQKTVRHKIQQQALLLEATTGVYIQKLKSLAKQVKSGDHTNLEGYAAQLYWSALMNSQFRRDPAGEIPNSLFNYGYAILRAATARALAGAGLLNTFGIHHHNQYNAFCLADDIMEPFRPFVDHIVYQLCQRQIITETLATEQKAALLRVLTMDCLFQGEKTSVGLALQRTANSLGLCFQEKKTSLLQFPLHAFATDYGY